MKHWLLLLSAILSPQLALGASDPLPTYEELCTYDELCGQLRNGDGTPIQPKDSVKKLLELMADPILEFSTLYGVDPRATAGAILAENTMNVQIDDEIQNFIAKNSATLGKPLTRLGMTVGPGQINLEPAIAADRHIASLGLRKARSAEEVSRLLLTPAGAAEYSAAIMRHAQDSYKAAGLDISGRPDILVSLYNMGQGRQSYESRARETKAAGRNPKPTYFGFFVGENLSLIEETIGWSPERGRFRAGQQHRLASNEVGLVKDTLTLRNAPPDCDTTGAGQIGEWQSRVSRQEYPQTENKSLYVEVTGQGVDCQLREWVQVRTNDGAIGWLPRTELQSEVEFQPHRFHTYRCQTPSEACLSDSLSQYGEKSSPRSVNGVHYFGLKRNDAADPVDWRKFDSECMREKYSDLKEMFLRPNDEEEELVPISADEVKNYARRMEEKKTAIAKALSLPSFNSPNNPFFSSVASVEMMFLEPCSSPELSCSLVKNQKEGLDTFLDKDPSQIKRYSEWASLFSSISFVDPIKSPNENPTSADLAAIREEKKRKRNLFLKTLREAISACEQLAPTLPNLSRQLVQTLREAEQAYTDENAYLQAAVRGQFSLCSQIAALVYFRANGKFPWGTEEAGCEYNHFSEMGPMPRFANRKRHATQLTQFGMDILKQMDFQEADYLELAKPVYTGLKQTLNLAQMAKNGGGSGTGMIGMGSGFGGMAMQMRNRGGGDLDKSRLLGCNFNALETAKAIERLAQVPCVGTVLVGSMEIAKGLNLPAGVRLVKDTNLPGDRLGVVYKDSCQAELRRYGKPPAQREKE